MPWLGFFHKMDRADLYVLLDNVQLTKNGWQNRNRVVDRQGVVHFLTVPVVMKGHTNSRLLDIQIDNSQRWQKKYWGRLADCYRRHPYFSKYAPELEAIVLSGAELLVEFNCRLIDFFRNALEIRAPIIRASSLDVSGKRSELLLDICRKLGAATYLSGPSGRDYLDQEIFEEHGIAIEFHSFNHPVYPSLHFTPGLSTLDLLMNCGEESRSVLGLTGQKEKSA
jgi:hypothetical protein